MEQNKLTDKELRRLKREQLLSLLLTEMERADRLQKELDELREGVEQERAQLKAAREDHELRLNKAGSIAEAALQLNDVFEAAQRAADDYVASVRKQSGQPDFIPPRRKKAAPSLRRAAEPEPVREAMTQAPPEPVKEKMTQAPPEPTEENKQAMTEEERIRYERARIERAEREDEARRRAAQPAARRKAPPRRNTRRRGLGRLLNR